LVTPFSQYVKNIALMNLLSEALGEPRFTRMDNSMWGMILGKSGRVPGEIAPELKELAKEKGLEFSDADPQSYYPDKLDEFKKDMVAKGWDEGPDQEELFEYAMHPEQYVFFKDGTAKKNFEADLAKAKEASLSHGFSEEDVKKLKRAKAMPIQAPVAGTMIWEIDVVDDSKAPEIGHAYKEGDTFCYINSTVYNYTEKVAANFTGKVIEIAAKQGAQVKKGDVLAYIERAE
jgi:pyruvate carboxylase subunit B